MKNTIYHKMLRTLKIYISERVVSFRNWKEVIEKWVRM